MSRRPAIADGVPAVPVFRQPGTADAGPDYPTPEGGHAEPASPARMAVLAHLARHPEGATETDLALAIAAALGEPLPQHDVQLVIQALRKAGRVTSDRHGGPPVRWHSTGARWAYWVRRGQPGRLDAPPVGRAATATAAGIKPRLADAPVMRDVIAGGAAVEVAS